jgi:hypothetical protein
MMIPAPFIVTRIVSQKIIQAAFLSTEAGAHVQSNLMQNAGEHDVTTLNLRMIGVAIASLTARGTRRSCRSRQ